MAKMVVACAPKSVVSDFWNVMSVAIAANPAIREITAIKSAG